MRAPELTTEEFLAAVRLAPNNANTIERVAYIYRRQGKMDQHLERLEQRVKRMEHGRGGERERHRAELKEVGEHTRRGLRALIEMAQAGDVNAREYLMVFRRDIDRALPHPGMRGVVQVDNADGSMLVVAENWMPGWRTEPSMPVVRARSGLSATARMALPMRVRVRT